MNYIKQDNQFPSQRVNMAYLQEPIYKWISELKPFTTTEEGAKINKQAFKATKARIKELEMENEIFKKATAIFAQKHQHQSQDDIIDEDDVNTGEYFDPYTYKTVLTYDGLQLVKIDAYNETGQVVERDYDFDDLGNLLDTVDYYDIHSVDYNWSGRRLDGINMYNDGILTQSIDYKYNSEGIRTYKKVGTDEYVLD